jgi:hypothetical protein
VIWGRFRTNMGYAWKLGVSAAAFLLHALMPAWRIPDRYNLLQTGIWIHIEVMQRDTIRDEESVAEAKKSPVYYIDVEGRESAPTRRKVIPWK